MKRIFSLILCFQSCLIFGQNLDSCGLDNQAFLNQNESLYLNEYFKESKDGFDFTGKKILFVTGSNGGTFGFKKNYFVSVKEWSKESRGKIATDFIPFNEEEKINSGGYDAILTYWVKVLITEKKKAKLIQRLNSLK